MSLDERVAIVTGGGNGIGKHYCQGLAAQGAAVVVAEIDPAAAETTAGELRAAGHRALEAPTDVSDEGERARDGRAHDGYVRPRGRPGQQRGHLRVGRLHARAARPDRRRGVGPHVRGERARPLALLPRGHPAHAHARLRQDHQHRVGHRLEGHALHAALRHVESRRGGADASAGARDRPDRHLRRTPSRRATPRASRSRPT